MLKRWKNPNNLVRRRSDGTLWTADGACPFPIDGWNFARALPKRIGWAVNRDDRFVTRNRETFDILWQRDH